MSIRHHPFWATLKPFVRVEAAEGSRFRLEIAPMPEPLRAQALDVSVQCVACGRWIRPVRSRKAPGNKRSTKVGHHLYLAAACPLAKCIGCSRGAAARDEYLRVRADVEAAEVVQ